MVIFDLGISLELRFFIGDGKRLEGDFVRLLGDDERSLVGDGVRSCLVGDGERLVGDIERLLRDDCCIGCGC
jgi:hypothetical protein